MDPTAATVGAGTWLWEQYGKRLTDSIKDFAKLKWDARTWQAAEARYREHLLAHYSKIRLLGNPRDIDIARIYIDVYALSRLSSRQRIDINNLAEVNQWFRSRASKESRFSMLKILGSTKRLFIMGKPGAGKSTFLRKAIFECCAGRINLTPIFISIKQWADSGISLVKAIERELSVGGLPTTEEFLQELFKEGAVLLLLDGLDEVSDHASQRQRAMAEVLEFARRYEKVPITITCRIAATDYSFTSFRYAEVADLLPEQQLHFIEKWYGHAPDLLRRLTSEWCKPEHSGLVDLARTPLLLALFCLAYDDTLKFPRRLVDVYEEAAGALLRRWDSSRGVVRDEVYKSLSPKRKEKLLARVAYRTFQQQQIILPKKAIERHITEYLNELPPLDRISDFDPTLVLKAIEAQHGLLVEVAMNVYAFSHLTLHEYFAAKYLEETSSDAELRQVVVGGGDGFGFVHP